MYNFYMTTNNPAISIEALNSAIDRRGWTPAKLSRDSGVSKGAISLILQGDRPNASAVVIAKLAKSLEVSMDYLMGLTSNFAPNADISKELAELLDLAQRLSYIKRKELLAIVGAMVEVEKAANVESIYNEMMALITRLAEIEGGEPALESLISHIDEFLTDSYEHDADDVDADPDE